MKADDYRKRRAQQARYRQARAIIVEWALWLAVAWAVWSLLSRLPGALEMEPRDPTPTPTRYRVKVGQLPAVQVTVRRERPPGLAKGKRYAD